MKRIEAIMVTMSIGVLIASSASAQPQPSSMVLSFTAGAEALSDSRGPDPDAEKQRVPKTTPEGEKERPGDQKKDKDDKDDDDDDSPYDYSDYVTDDDGTQASPSGRRHKTRWVEGDLATVSPADSAQDAPMWDDPGGEELGAELVADLPTGTNVVVHGSRVLHEVRWVQVSTDDGRTPAGWVWVEDLVERRRTKTAPGRAFGIVGGLSWVYFGPQDVSDEYKDGGWRAALRGFKRVGSVGRFSLSAGYAQEEGNPKFNYVTPTLIDYPQRSRLKIVDLGLNAGLDLPLSRNWSFRTDIGPTLFWVRENAKMDYDSLQGGVVVASGRREESLERWRIGGQFDVGFGRALGSDTRIGLLLNLFVISWESESRKSLTLDFIGTKPLVGGGGGIYLSY